MTKILASLSAYEGYHFDAPSHLLKAWSESTIFAGESPDKSVIDINDMIGEDFFTDGFTEKKLSALIRVAGKQTNLTVNINSPGGDVFQGLAIYNRLKAHEGEITVNVLGVAGSIASVIAMAGDTINMAKGSLIMIHNAHTGTLGNRHDMANAAEVLGKVDESMADIYSTRTGMDVEGVVALMDGKVDGTFMTVSDAMSNGFADAELDIDKDAVINAKQLPADVVAKRKIEAALAAQGMPRKQRAQQLKNLTVERDAGSLVERDADTKALVKSMESFINTLKSK